MPIDARHHGAAEIRDVGPELRQRRRRDCPGCRSASPGSGRSSSIATSPTEKLSRPCASPLKWSDAVGDPFHGRFRRASGLRGQRVFAVHEALRAEAAADIAGDDADLLRRHLQDLVGQRVAQAVHALAGDREREALGLRVVLRDDAARLHEVGDQAVVLDVERDDPVAPWRRWRRPRPCRPWPYRRRRCPAARSQTGGRAGADRGAHVDDRGKRSRSRSRSPRRRRGPARTVSATTKATASPTCLATSLARTGMWATWSCVPSALGIGAWHGTSPRWATSAAVRIRLHALHGARGLEVART